MSIRTQQIPDYNITYDMVRAIASLVVFVLHFKPLILYSVSDDIPALNYFDKAVSLLAVEFFFALSGILLGRVLFDVLTTPDQIRSLSVFVMRRIYRTFPAYYVALLIFCGLYICSGEALPDNLPSYFFFLQNLNGFYHDFFGVSWSLSIEEIFYGFFALCLLALTRTRYTPVAKLRLTITVFIMATASIRFINLLNFEIWYNEISLSVFSRLDCIAIAMLVMTYRDWKVPVAAYVAAGLFILGALVYFSLFWQHIAPEVTHIIALNGLYLGMPMSCAILIQYWAQNIKMIPRKIIVFFADISYPLYVFHMIGFYYLINFMPSLSLIFVLLGMGGCVLFSYLFHCYIERPILAARPSYSERCRKSVAKT